MNYMSVSPYVYPGLKYNYLTDDQRKELYRTLPVYKVADIIKECVSAYYNVTIDNLSEKGQQGIKPWARHVFCFLAKEITHLSNQELARLINRDRSTVSSTIKSVRDSIEVQKQYMDQVIHLRVIIKNRIAEAKNLPVQQIG